MSDLPISLAEYYRAGAAIWAGKKFSDLGLHPFWGHGICQEHGHVIALTFTDGTEPPGGYIVCAHVGFERKIPVRKVTRSSQSPFASEER